MVDFKDRRYSDNSAKGDYSDFNNPAGTFELTTPGYEEQDRWSGQAVDKDGRNDVHGYFTRQKGTKTWQEATRRAKRSADSRARKGHFANASAYAEHYQNSLVNVMATKGKGLAEKNGELKHPQSGYGRI